jgi:hypothetical protein
MLTLLKISASPSFSSLNSIPIPNHWRHTPPPTSSAVRSNKRKYKYTVHILHGSTDILYTVDDRFDPYPSSSKRRAVSPSVSYIHNSHSLASPLSNSRTPHAVRLPISIPPSTVSSATSSPTIGNANQYLPYSYPYTMTGSPTLRAPLVLASPVLRPIARSAGMRRAGEGDEREVEGAGEGVGGLSLG